MPAAIMKSELNKINNSEGSDLPIRQAIIIIEHKIRNLEKRKVISKLLKENYYN